MSRLLFVVSVALLLSLLLGYSLTYMLYFGTRLLSLMRRRLPATIGATEASTNGQQPTDLRPHPRDLPSGPDTGITCPAARPTFHTLRDIVAFLRRSDSSDATLRVALEALIALLPIELARRATDPTRNPSDRIADVIYTVDDALSTDVQDLSEQRKRQEDFPDLQEVWVIARNFLDLGPFYETVKYNIGTRRVTYVYFQVDRSRFDELTRRLKADLGDWVQDYLWCVIAPTALFTTDVAIYNPGRSNMIGWVNRLERGQTKTLYQMDPEQLDWIYTNLVRPAYLQYETQKRLPLPQRENVLRFPEGRHSVH